MKLVLRKNRPQIHRQFNTAMIKAAQPVLVEAVRDGELDLIECGKIETQMNKSLNNPYFQMDQRHLKFLTKRLKQQQQKSRRLN